jgi:hypothetical protein
MLNPYLLYIKIGLAALAVAFLFWLGWHEMGIRADLKAKTAEAALQKAAADQHLKQFQDYINLNKDISNAIQNVKIKSSNYIQSVETSPPPVISDGGTVVLVPAGVPNGAAVPGLPGYKNYSAGRVGSGTSGNPDNEAGQ